MQLLDFGLSCSLILAPSLYAISVRQTGDLPPPSFRSRLAADTLGVRLYPSRCRAGSGLSPVRLCPCQAHQEDLRERFTSSQPEQTDEEPAAEESTVPVVEEEPIVPVVEEPAVPSLDELSTPVVELLPKGLTSIQLKVLQRIGVNTIGDFLALSEEEIRNLDVLTVRQKSKLLSLQGEVATPHSSAGEELTFHSTPDEETMVAPPVEEKSAKDDILLSKLGLPRRVKETIHEIGAYTLGDFMKLTEDDILNTEGIS